MYLTLLAAAAIILLAGLAVPLFIHYYEYHGFGPQDGVWRGGSGGRKIVAITFDDGPSPEYTPIILDILKDKEVKATFFMTGAMVESHPEIAARAAAEGHDIGNHTYHHVNLVFLKGKKLAREIEMGEEALTTALNRKPVLFRPPRSILPGEARRLLIAKGYSIIMWTASAADWMSPNVGVILRRLKKAVRPGAAFLFHDGGAVVGNKGGRRESTVLALPLVIDMIRNQGYELVTMTEMLNSGAEK
jgi:peptidoglycan/xylan/chitin deacetylase (PgdA/CDA1 family)